MRKWCVVGFAVLAFAALYFWVGGAWHGLLHDQPHQVAAHHDGRSSKDLKSVPSVEIPSTAPNHPSAESNHGIPKRDEAIHEPHPMLPPQVVPKPPHHLPGKATIPSVPSLQEPS